VFAALQPIANHIHRPADYPADTPMSKTTGSILRATTHDTSRRLSSALTGLADTVMSSSYREMKPHPD
jgi:hypothetical protein